MVLVTFRDKIVFTDQSGQFWNILDLVGINPNLRGGLWNLPYFHTFFLFSNALACDIRRQIVPTRHHWNKKKQAKPP